jgi:predicted GTPase
VLEDPAAVRGRRVVVVDDGPTLTHGGMPYGAGWVAATAAGAEVVDPRPWAAPAIGAAFAAWPHLGPVLPALGYGAAQLAALEQTLRSAEVDVVVSGTPLDLRHLVSIDKPIVRARYEYTDGAVPSLEEQLDRFVERFRLGTA